MIDFTLMTKTDTATGVKTDVRIVCPLDGQAVASAVAAAEMAQKKEVGASCFLMGFDALRRNV